MLNQGSGVPGPEGQRADDLLWVLLISVYGYEEKGPLSFSSPPTASPSERSKGGHHSVPRKPLGSPRVEISPKAVSPVTAEAVPRRPQIWQQECSAADWTHLGRQKQDAASQGARGKRAKGRRKEESREKVEGLKMEMGREQKMGWEWARQKAGNEDRGGKKKGEGSRKRRARSSSLPPTPFMCCLKTICILPGMVPGILKHEALTMVFQAQGSQMQEPALNPHLGGLEKLPCLGLGFAPGSQSLPTGS